MVQYPRSIRHVCRLERLAGVGGFCGGNREANARARPRGEARRHHRRHCHGVTGCRSKRCGQPTGFHGAKASRSVKLSRCPHPKRRATERRPAGVPAPRAHNGVRPGVIRMVRGTETLQARVLDRRRHLIPNTLAEFTRFLRFPTGATHPIEPRLVTLVAMVSDHFGGREIIVVSGFRPTRRDNSRHTPITTSAGRSTSPSMACPTKSCVISVEPSATWGWATTPTHRSFISTSATASAQWIDYAGPGQAPRYHRPEERKTPMKGRARSKGWPGGQPRRRESRVRDDPDRLRDARPGKETGISSGRDSTGEHSVYPGRK